MQSFPRERSPSLASRAFSLGRVAASLVAASLVAAPLVAHAEAPPPRTSALSWTRLPGAEGCIDPRALARAVEARLGRPAFVAPTQGDVIIEGRIEPASPPSTFRATITVSDDKGAPIGSRGLTSERADCRALDEELALVIALLIDPNAALAPPQALPAPPAPFTPLTPLTPPAPALPPTPPPPQVIVQRQYIPITVEFPVRRPRDPFRVSAEAGAAVGFGLLPSPGGGAAIRVRLAPPPKWPSFEFGGAIWLDQQPAASPVSATFSLAWGSLAVCPLGGTALGTALSACVGAQVGSLRVGGFGFDLAYRQEQIVFDATIEARARRRIVGPLFLGAGVGVIAPIIRDRFYYLDAQDGRRDVFQMSPVAGTLEATVGLELP